MSDLAVRALDLVGDASAHLDPDDFRSGLLAALRRALPCDYVSINQVAPEPAANWSVADPPVRRSTHPRRGPQPGPARFQRR